MTKLRFLNKNKIFMKYFKNTSWLLGERIFKMGVSFIVIILLTRYLGPEKFGLLSYAQSYVGIFVAFAALGIDVILVRELTKNTIDNNRLIGTAFILKLYAAFISLALILLINSFIDDEEVVLLTNIIAIILLFRSVNVIDTFFQANILSKNSSIANTIAFVVSSLIKLLLIYFEADLIYFAYVVVLDSIFVAIGYIYIYYLRKQSILLWKYDNKIAMYFIKNGWPLMLVTMAVFLYTKIDQIMIKHLIGDVAVGNYAAAIRVSELFYFIPFLIAQSLFPKIIKARKKSVKEYFSLLEKLSKTLVWLAIPISLGIFIYSEPITSILYGDEYTQASGVLSILAFGLILVSVGTVSTKILYAEHYERKYLYRSVLGVFINIGLNFFLIEILGLNGAAIATLITLFVIYYVYDIFDKDLHKFYYLKWSCYQIISFKRKR